jgi:3,4-dihydroxy 2-butanone 4-phosphate synthase/GTP cyclohydrolase II
MEHYALTKGDVADGRPVLVRMHVLDPLEDVLCLNEDRWQQVPNAMLEIASEGRGAVIILRDPSPNAVSERLRARGAGSGPGAGPSTSPSTGPKQLRQYGVGAQILANLGIHELIMLTNSPTPKLVGLDGYEISIIDTRPIPNRRGK